MKFALILCSMFAFAIAGESFWGEGETKNVLEDEPDIDVKAECTGDDDCGKGECCLETLAQCKPKREEGERCEPLSTCYRRCKDGLECKENDVGIHRCSSPMAPSPEPEESGSGEMDIPVA